VSQKEPPKIEFPCDDYPIKVLGTGVDDYEQLVIDIIRVHAPDFDATSMQVRDSRNGRFRSITVYIRATGPDQLQRIHTDLTAQSFVHMVM
jgi:putative lipoic acid-binding regulatory protein